MPSSSSSVAPEVAPEGAPKKEYSEWLKDKAEAVAKGEMMEAVDDKAKVKLNDDVKGHVMEFLGGGAFKPRVKPFALYKKKYDSKWDDKKSKIVDRILRQLEFQLERASLPTEDGEVSCITVVSVQLYRLWESELINAFSNR